MNDAMRVLVVEDEDERKVASFIRQGLEEEGHTVEVAGDDLSALDLVVAVAPYDLIVLDVMLPGLGRPHRRCCGWMTSRWIRPRARCGAPAKR
jgi:CheY-like chemotaxis protein